MDDTHRYQYSFIVCKGSLSTRKNDSTFYLLLVHLWYFPFSCPSFSWHTQNMWYWHRDAWGRRLWESTNSRGTFSNLFWLKISPKWSSGLFKPPWKISSDFRKENQWVPELRTPPVSCSEGAEQNYWPWKQLRIGLSFKVSFASCFLLFHNSRTWSITIDRLLKSYMTTWQSQFPGFIKIPLRKSYVVLVKKKI